MSKDISIYESGNGGEFNYQNEDVVLESGFFNQVYLALFGGNVEQSTTADMQGERFDWWANEVLFEGDSVSQFNSETERTLLKVSLSSSGLKQIEQAVKKDLEYLDNKFETSATLAGNNKVEIYVKLIQEGEKYLFVWDAAKSELIENRII